MATRINFIVYNPDGTEAYNGSFSYVPVTFEFTSNNIAIYDGKLHIDVIGINVSDVVRYKVVDGTETYYDVGETVEFPNNVGITIYIYAEQASGVIIPTGTYVANDSFISQTVADLSELGSNFPMTFNSNGTTFTGMNIQLSSMGIPQLYYDSILVFGNSWVNETFKTVTLESDQTVNNEDFATWFKTNYTLQAEEEAPTETVEITYNGEVIATLTAGQTATLKCAGMKMLSDVVAKVIGASEEVTLGDITITVNSFSALKFALFHLPSQTTVESKTASSGTITFNNITSDMYIEISGAINVFNFGNVVNCVGNTSDRTITDIGENATISVSNAD